MSLFQIGHKYGSLVVEVLKNRPSCFSNISVTCRYAPIQEVAQRHMQEDGNILHHRGSEVKTRIYPVFRTRIPPVTS
jgi:hypothetical protein